MKIFLGADHGGFKMKEDIKDWLIEEGHEVEDCGNTVLDPDDDYPKYAITVAEKVAASSGKNYGILFCRSGAGMIIAANKVKGIRAVDVFDLTSAIHARTNNDANVMSIGADWMDPGEARLVIKNFLETEFMGEERHERRIRDIAQLESEN
ncbi:MAG: RpiB/LacA/LacB family sugar-phosphate isomerase [Patescibacteria group bacterium]